MADQPEKQMGRVAFICPTCTSSFSYYLNWGIPDPNVWHWPLCPSCMRAKLKELGVPELRQATANDSKQ